ncbi:MAG: hypothetical protein ACKVQC_10495 [Elusimicrobiota bacterium]
MKLTQIVGANLFFILFLSGSVHSYDEVKVEKVVPLVDKKMEPSNLVLSPNNEIWTINQSIPALQQITEDGKIKTNIISGKKDDFLFSNPVDFDFTADNQIVVADPGKNRVVFLMRSGAKKSKPTISNVIPAENVSCVAVSRDNVLAVGFNGKNYVDFYSFDGILLARLTSPQKNPLVSANDLTFSKDGVLWVLDGNQGKLHRFSSERKWLGVTEGLDDAQRFTVNDYGFAYVSTSKGRWKEVNNQGVVTGTFGTKGKAPGQLGGPDGLVFLDEQRLAVLEKGNHRFQFFQIENRDKGEGLFLGPASYVQVKNVGSWDLRLDFAWALSNGSLLINNKDKNSLDFYSAEGKLTKSIKGKEKKKVIFQDVTSVFQDADGKIWLSDQNEDSIKRLSELEGVDLSIGKKGKKEGSLKNPSFFSLREDKSIVVVDKGNSRIQVLGQNGLFQFTLGKQGKLEGQFLSINGLVSNQNYIAVLDSERKVVLFFDHKGKFSFEVKAGQNPQSLAKDFGGRFFVLDSQDKKVRIYNAMGQFLCDFTASGHFIACGPEGKLFVADEKKINIYEVSLIPRKISDIDVIDQQGDLSVQWLNSPEAVSYKIYVSSNNSDFSYRSSVTSSPYLDSHVRSNLNYRYAVVGINSQGQEGTWSVSRSMRPSKKRDLSLIAIEKSEFKPIFTASYKTYSKKPIGMIEIQNNDEKFFRNVKISLSMKKYTDFSTEIIIPELLAGEKKQIPVPITLNNQVLELTENTPVQVDVRLSYYEDNIEKSVTQNAPVELYSRNAISWDEKSRLASFVTPRDVPVVDLARQAIKAFLVPLKASTVTKPLAKAALMFETLNAIGISYVSDPSTPYSEISSKKDALDFVQYPRETLKRKTGDCDDTTALLSALLESIGVETAFVDTPGHIFLMVNLEENNPEMIGLPKEKFIEYAGSFWVPIETTQLGKGFQQAWQTALLEVKAGMEKNQVEFVRFSEASQKYEPITLLEPFNHNIDFPESAVRLPFETFMNKIQSEKYSYQIEQLKQLMAAHPQNKMLDIQMGMVHVEGGKILDAKKIFESLKNTNIPEVKSAALNNLGNLSYLDGKYAEANSFYSQSLSVTPQDGGIMLNHARSFYKLGKGDDCKRILSQAKEIHPSWKEFVSDLPSELLP